MFLRYQQNNCLKHAIDYISDKDGMAYWSYTSKITVTLMLMLMMFYDVICISDRRTQVKSSIIITNQHTYFTLIGIHFSNLSHTCYGHFSWHNEEGPLMKTFTQNSSGKCHSYSRLKLQKTEHYEYLLSNNSTVPKIKASFIHWQ